MKTITQSNPHFHILLKISAIVFGYSFWLLFASNQITTKTITAPVLYYNTESDETISGPQEISLVIKGGRTDLSIAEHQGISVHIDAALLTESLQEIALDASNAILPSSITVVDYVPHTIIATKIKKVSDTEPQQPTTPRVDF